MRIFIFLTIFIMGINIQQAEANEDDSCLCEAFSCNSCEISTGVTFTTNKCDMGQKVKSCSKPTCVSKNPLPAACVTKKTKNEIRKIASIQPKKKIKIEIGKVENSKGLAWIVEVGGQKSRVRRKMNIFESDIVKTSKNGKVKLRFYDFNELMVGPNSKIKLSEYKISKGDQKRKVLFDLIQGKVKSDVKQKYEKSKASYYKIKTPSAEAGVKGTEFTISYKRDLKNNKNITKVQTLEGNVELSDLNLNNSIEIKAGHYASYVADASNLIQDKDIAEFIHQGSLTPIYELSGAEKNRINANLGFKKTKRYPNRVIASKVKKHEHLCGKPSGELNQCLYSCKNNPKGVKRCMIERVDVSCVRSRCNASGIWAEETRVPASMSAGCRLSGQHVDKCDY